MFWDKRKANAVFLGYGPAGRLEIQKKSVEPKHGAIHVKDWKEAYFVPEPDFSRGFRDFVYIRGRPEPINLYDGGHHKMDSKTLIQMLDSTLLDELARSIAPRRAIYFGAITDFVATAIETVAENIRRAWYGYQKRD